MGGRRKSEGVRSDLCGHTKSILKYLKKFDLAMPMWPQDRCTTMSNSVLELDAHGLTKTRLIDLGRVMNYETNSWEGHYDF